MKKRLFAVVAALALACSLAPSVALADGGGASDPLVAVTIEIGVDGTPSVASGEGWGYDTDRGVLTLDAGQAFTFTGSACNPRVNNYGVIVDGEFNGYVANIEGGTIAGGTFNDYVVNYKMCVISGGTFNSVDNQGVIRGGTFNNSTNNSGAIGGESVFNGYVQNGHVTFDPDKNRSCTITGGTFNANEIDNFGTIGGGSFGGKILSRGIITGGSFSSTSSVTSNDDFTTTGGGTIVGGAFAGTVVNGDPDPDWNAAVITGGTFTGTVTNHDTIEGGIFALIVANEESGAIEGGTFLGDVTNRGDIEGGFFARAVVNAGGTMRAGAFPVSTSLTGLSIAEAEDAEPVATYEKDSDESNRLTLIADEGYTLPDAISVRCGTADGAELVAGTAFTYDAATGAIAIKKGAVAGPLFLAANGVAEVAPVPPSPMPDNPGSADPATPAPLPAPTDAAQFPAASNATTLASTGDNALLQVALGLLVFAGGVLAACLVARRKRSRR